MAESKKSAASTKKAAATEQATVTVCCNEPGAKTATAGGAGAGAVYGLGLIGAAVYYIQESTGFGEFLVACLKAIVWPAFVVYDLLKHMS